MVRRNLAHECSHQLHVAASCNEGAHRTINDTVEGARSPAVGLAEHLNTVAALVSVRLNPDAVLLVGTCRPGVLAAELVGPGNALIACTEREGTLTAVTANDTREGVRLRAEDRRVGAVLVTELCVDRDTVHLDVAVVVRSARVSVRGRQIHVTRDETLTNTVSVGQVCGLGHAAAGDHVRVDDLVRISSIRRGTSQLVNGGLCHLRSGSLIHAAREVARHQRGSER